MKQQTFEQRRQSQWQRYSETLAVLRGRKKQDKAGQAFSSEAFPSLYRRLCSDLALARTRGYSLELIEQLERLRAEGHALLYQPRSELLRNMVGFVARDFPQQVRQEWRLTLLCSVLLFGPMLLLTWAIGSNPDFVYRVLSPEQVASIESMYDTNRDFSRGAEGDVFMFAFYIMNNIGVALRTFAGGLLLGIGAGAILLYNGLHIGAVTAHLSFEGYHETFWSFVIGHGSLELPAIVLAGVAGMRMGLALLMPGALSRLDALRHSAGQAVHLLYGVMLMLFLAAGLEAFWSASGFAPMVKYVIGGLLWLLMLAYFVFAGRQADV